MNSTKSNMSKANTAKTAVGSKQLDSFLNELMGPAANNSTQESEMAGDISLYKSVAPADAYTSKILTSLLKSQATQSYATKISRYADYPLLITADFLIEHATEEKRSEIEKAISSSESSSSLETNLRNAASIFRQGISPESKNSELEKLSADLKVNYIRNNKNSIERSINQEREYESELNKRVSKKARIAGVVTASLIIAAIALMAYSTISIYNEQVEFQKNFGEYIEQTYNLQLPDTFYQNIIGGK